MIHRGYIHHSWFAHSSLLFNRNVLRNVSFHVASIFILPILVDNLFPCRNYQAVWILLGHFWRSVQNFFWCGLETTTYTWFDLRFWLDRLFANSSGGCNIDISWRSSSVELKINARFQSTRVEELGGCGTIKLWKLDLVLVSDPLWCVIIRIYGFLSLVQIRLKDFPYNLCFIFDWKLLFLRGVALMLDKISVERTHWSYDLFSCFTRLKCVHLWSPYQTCYLIFFNGFDAFLFRGRRTWAKKFFTWSKNLICVVWRTSWSANIEAFAWVHNSLLKQVGFVLVMSRLIFQVKLGPAFGHTDFETVWRLLGNPSTIYDSWPAHHLSVDMINGNNLVKIWVEVLFDTWCESWLVKSWDL